MTISTYPGGRAAEGAGVSGVFPFSGCLHTGSGTKEETTTGLFSSALKGFVGVNNNLSRNKK